MSSNSSSNSSGSQRLNFLPSKPRESEKLTLDFPPRAGSLLRSAAAFNHQAATYETNELDIPGLPSKGLSYSSSVAHSHSPLFGQKRPHNALASAYTSIPSSSSALQFPSDKSLSPSVVPSRPTLSSTHSVPVPSTRSPLMNDLEFRRMFIDEAPTGVIIDIAPEEPSSGDDSVVPDLPVDYERASSVSCKSQEDLLRSAIESELQRQRCDIRETSSAWKIQGTAFSLSDSVEFRINIYRNPKCHSCSLTVEVNRFSGRSDVFSRFFSDIVQCLSKHDLLCDASNEYPQGQFNCGTDVDQLAVHGSSVSSSTSGSPAKRRHVSSSGDDVGTQFDIVPRRPGFAPRGASLPAPALDFSGGGAPPKPRFPPKRAFSSFVPPRRPMDLTLSKKCVRNLLEPFRSSSTPEEKRAAAITLARACDNPEGRTHLFDDDVLAIIEQILRSDDKELVRSGTIILCRLFEGSGRLFEGSGLSRSRVSMLWDRFHPIVIERRQTFCCFDSPDLDRYLARMLAAPLECGMTSHLHEDLSSFLKRMATTHSCTQVQRHSRRALSCLRKSSEGGALFAAAC